MELGNERPKVSYYGVERLHGLNGIEKIREDNRS